MSFLFKELDGDLGESLGALTRNAPRVLVDYEKEGFQIWLQGNGFFIKDLNILIFEGESYVYDEETGKYELNSDATIFYDAKTAKEVFYSYEDDLFTCLYYYCQDIGQPKTEEEINNFKCEYFHNDGQFLRDVVLKGKNLENEIK